jgi:hypothetical protein
MTTAKSTSVQERSRIHAILLQGLMKRGVCRCGGEDALRASPAVLSMWPCTLEFDEEKSKHAGLAHENGFGQAYLHGLLRLVNGAATVCPCHKRV